LATNKFANIYRVEEDRLFALLRSRYVSACHLNTQAYDLFFEFDWIFLTLTIDDIIFILKISSMSKFYA